MANLINRTVIACLLGIAFFLSNCATQEEATRPQKLLEGLDLEFAGNRIELQNPLPRNGEEVEVIVLVRNRGNQDGSRIPVFFYDNLKVFSTEEIDLEPGGQKKLSARWRATSGNHLISVTIDPSHYFKEMDRARTEVSTTVLVN